MHLRIQDLNLAVALDRVSRNLARTLGADLHRFGAVAVQLGGQTLDIEHDLGDILFHTGNGGKLMHNAVDLDGLNGNARQAGKQHTAQAIAQSGAETPFQRLYHEAAVSSVVG